jgi:hypothetical protein
LFGRSRNSVCWLTLAARAQVAAKVQDERLLVEGCARVHNALAPLLALPSRSPFLVKALLAVYAALSTITNVVQDSFDGQEAGRRAGARSLSALTLHAAQLAQHEHEAGVVKQVASLDVQLLSAYDPRVEIAGRPSSADACASSPGDPRC